MGIPPLRVRNDRTAKRGFTLIELSIVLVIIGLLVGGVLVGRDLISASSRRAMTSQVERYMTAAQTFRLKYNCVPGDCATAVEKGLGSGANPGANGNGDGILSGGGPSEFGPNWQWTQPEKLNFWYHLGRAQLVDGNFRGYDGTDPGAAGYAGYHPAPKHGAARLGVAAIVPGPIEGGNALGAVDMYYDPGGSAYGFMMTAMDAYAIDQKADDGLPRSGKVRINYPYGSLLLDGSTAGCGGNGADNTYDLAGVWDLGAPEASPPNRSRVECGLIWMNAF